MADDTELVRELGERWNAGDLEGSLELYADDAVMLAGSDWPEQTTWRGHDGIRANMTDWRSVWESSQIEFGELDAVGGRVLATGAWINRGRTSGADTTMDFAILVTVRDGKIAVLEWFTDHDAALAAARAT